jgi:hypothetical protein
VTGRAWARPAILGGFDGLVCLIGSAVPALSAAPHTAFREALGIGLAETVGMAAAEWQSESRNGPAASLIVGAATGATAIVPGVPLAFGTGLIARLAAVALVVAVAVAIALLRAAERGRRRALAESLLIITAVALVVGAGQWIAGGA